jgi:hypothetical protein
MGFRIESTNQSAATLKRMASQRRIDALSEADFFSSVTTDPLRRAWI